MTVGIPTWSLEPGTVVATVPGNSANLTHGLSGKVTKVGRKWVHVATRSRKKVSCLQGEGRHVLPRNNVLHPPTH